MKQFGIFYGSTTGTTEEIAKQLAKILGIQNTDVHNVAETTPSVVADYRTLILGSSTWGSGDLQDNWYDFIAGLEAMDLKDKRIAIFGCGDETMSDTFCDAVGKIYDRLQPTEAEFIGSFNTDGYHYDHSDAIRDGKAVGLILDEVNHPELTATRLRQWTSELN